MNRLALVLVVALTTPAFAGGMVLPIRGVRSLERAGALVAGADDADALWLDPAGLAHLAGAGRRAFLFDVAYVYQPVDYTRIDGAGNPLPKVSNQQPGTSAPTIAAALGIGDKLVIAGGIATPYAGLHRYDVTGPQRYASISVSGSSYVMVTVGAAYAVSPQLRIGATLQDTVSSLTTLVMVSDCPGATVCAPEDPDFDALAQISQTDYVSPSGSVGVQYDASPTITLGATVQAPTRISSTGTLDAQLPRSTLFTGAMVVGDHVHMSFTLPPVVRAGVELHAGSVRVEAALDTELWSMHDAIAIEPDNVRIENAPGAGTYTLGAMSIPRHYKTSFAPSLGVEVHTDSAMFGAGVSYETAAAPKDYVSVMSVDAAKLLLGLGGGYASGDWQIGGAVGFVKQSDITVSLADAKLPQLQPIHDQGAPVYINAGTYHSSYILAGIRAARRF